MVSLFLLSTRISVKTWQMLATVQQLHIDKHFYFICSYCAGIFIYVYMADPHLHGWPAKLADNLSAN